MQHGGRRPSAGRTTAIALAVRWVTAREAAALVRRDISRIHTWIREDRIRAIRDDDGILHVRTDELLELEARMRNRRNNTTRRQPQETR